ncbi:flagellar protein FlaG [Alkalithermobacter paradoxus]|uniref:Flagellar protein FlaG n=1 Tax=Alkalithermobacter paradoxus TaxID=29349 RepID=A0A1V4I822_9FIRM|nr:flagellar protein FlaG [[Clostridium] thermoalcaliphilum]
MRIDSSPINNMIPNNQDTTQVKVSNEKVDVSKEIKNKEENVSFPAERKLIEAIEKSNKELIGMDTSLKFSIHEKTKQITVKVIDNKTEEVIREIPSEKVLDMISDIMEKTGIFIDKKV